MKVWTSGICMGNTGYGGWACVHETFKLCGGETCTTSNRMELTAVIRALEKNPNVAIVTNSIYVKDGIVKRVDDNNQDLWERFDELVTMGTKWEAASAGSNAQCAASLSKKCATMLKG